MSDQHQKVEAAEKFDKVEIVTDGTPGGTTIKLNGKPIENLRNIHFSFWNDGLPNPLSLSWTTQEPDVKPGTIGGSHHFYLVPPADEKAEAVMAKAAITPEEFRARPATNDRRALYAKM